MTIILRIYVWLILSIVLLQHSKSPQHQCLLPGKQYCCPCKLFFTLTPQHSQAAGVFVILLEPVCVRACALLSVSSAHRMPHFFRPFPSPWPLCCRLCACSETSVFIIINNNNGKKVTQSDGFSSFLCRLVLQALCPDYVSQVSRPLCSPL